MNTNHWLNIHKIRETQMNPENPRFVTYPKYAFKTDFFTFVLSNKIKFQNVNTGDQFFMKTRALPNIQKFILHSELNAWRNKNRDPDSKTYNIRNNQLVIYADVPYNAITAFLSTEDHHKEIINDSLISESSKFRQELLIIETELQELQIKFENLIMESNENSKTTTDDYWRRQNALTKQIMKTDESNMKQIKTAYA